MEERQNAGRRLRFGVGEQRLAGRDRAQKVASDRPVMGLTGRELDRDRQAVSVDLRRQPAARAPQASWIRAVPGSGEWQEVPAFFRSHRAGGRGWW